MSSRQAARQTFVDFATKVLGLELTPPQRVLLAVSIDGVPPRDLVGGDREAATTLFGPVDEIDPSLRRVLVWRLGRASGKTTLAAALSIYGAWSADMGHVGRGQLPCAFVVSPTKPTARIMLRIARELVRGSALEPFCETDTADGFVLVRPDHRKAEVRCVAASKGGANLRGRDVIVLVLDESEFFASNADGGADGYAISDRDQISAAMPRLLEYVVCVSTPWPAENVTAEMFDKNWGHPVDAVAALGTSMFMRPTAQLLRDIQREASRDPENAEREYECKPGVRGGSRLFDLPSIEAAIVTRPLVVGAPAGSFVGCGGDVAFERDSSAVAVVARTTNGEHTLLEFDEVIPQRGVPLTPRFVIRDRFVPTMRKHGVHNIWLDAHYRQSVIEHLSACSVGIVDAPPGIDGKYDSYMHLRGLLRAGQLRLPNAPRLIAQLRGVQQLPLPGGKTRITSPRRAGSGHGDIISALVLGCWAVRSEVEAQLAAKLYREKVDGLARFFNGAGAYDDEYRDAEADAALAQKVALAAAAPAANAREAIAWEQYLRRIGSPAAGSIRLPEDDDPK